MIGEVYLATALAIFIAVFGWSDKIFGLSKETKEKESNFIQGSGLTLNNYRELRRVLKNKDVDSIAKTKKIVSLLKRSKIRVGDKKIFDKLKENENIFSDLSRINRRKKSFFISLFIYLFFAGSYFLLFEFIYYLSTLHLYSIIAAQVILLIMISYGGSVYIRINNGEAKIQRNLISLILMQT